MKRTVTDCDGCGKKNIPECRPVNLVTGRKSNGVEMDDEYYSFDFCSSCLTTLLQAFLSKLSYEDAVKFKSNLQYYLKEDRK